MSADRASSGTVLFAGGGTGGHLYPAMAIAECLRERRPDLGVRYLCSTRPLDAEILAKAGEESTPISASPLVLRPSGLARFVRSWQRSVRECVDAIAREAEPAIVVAMGGFVCAPAASAARKLGAPVVLVNLDTVPGLANKLVARRSDEVFTAAKGGPGAFVGPVVRRAFWNLPDPSACRRAFGLDPDRNTLLITGGSQGARSINDLMCAIAREHVSSLKPWQVIHQCGRDAGDALERAYTDAGVRALVSPFVDDMPSAWGASDLCITRGGAGAVAELSVTRTPSVVLPYPYHKDEHQRENARGLEDAGGVVIEKDLIEARANMPRAGAAIARLLSDDTARTAMRAALEAAVPDDGAKAVAERILGRLDPA